MSSSQPAPTSRHFPIWLFIGLFAVVDFLAIPIASGGQQTVSGVILGGLVYGVIFGQLGLLSIWAVAGPARALVRLPLTTLVGMFLVACFVAGIVVAGDIPSQPGEMAPGLLFLPLIFLSAQLPLWVLRLVTGGCIVRVDARTGQMPIVQRQFGVGHLMAATVVVALAFGLASSGMRLFGAEEAMGDMGGMGMFWGILVVYGVVFCLSTLFVTLPCLWAGLGTKNPRAGALGLAIYVGLMVSLWVAIQVLFSSGMFSLGMMSGRAVMTPLFLSGSPMFVVLGTLYVARYCGYRYRRGGRPQPIVATGSPFASCNETPPETEAAQSPVFDSEQPPKSSEAAE